MQAWPWLPEPEPGLQGASRPHTPSGQALEKAEKYQTKNQGRAAHHPKGINTKTSLEVHDAILLELRIGEGHLDGRILPVVREPDGRAPPPPPGAQAYSNSQ